MPWASPPPHAPGTVHVADSSEQLIEALARSPPGRARRPVPARRPDDDGRPDPLPGRHRVDVGLHPRSSGTPSATPATRGSAASGTPPTGTVRRPHADAGSSGWRPASASRVLARRVLGPHEIEARDENLVGGAINGGTSQLHQQLVFRPVPGLGRAETPWRLFLARPRRTPVAASTAPRATTPPVRRLPGDAAGWAAADGHPERVNRPWVSASPITELEGGVEGGDASPLPGNV